MENLKDLAKKGGVESIVAVIVLVGLVILLIVVAILPTMGRVEDSAGTTMDTMDTFNASIDSGMQSGLEDLNIPIVDPE